LRVTDDTVLARVLAGHLAGRSGRIDQDALALDSRMPGRRFRPRLRGAVQHLFARVIEGTWWRAASRGEVRWRRVLGQRRGDAGRRSISAAISALTGGRSVRFGWVRLRSPGDGASTRRYRG